MRLNSCWQYRFQNASTKSYLNQSIHHPVFYYFFPIEFARDFATSFKPTHNFIEIMTMTHNRTRILLVSIEDPKEDESLLVAHSWLVSTLVVSKLNVDLVIELWISSVVANDVTKMIDLTVKWCQWKIALRTSISGSQIRNNMNFTARLLE